MYINDLESRDMNKVKSQREEEQIIKRIDKGLVISNMKEARSMIKELA